MFVVEPRIKGLHVAASPEEAVKKARERERAANNQPIYYDVWDADSTDFYVIATNPDWEPMDDPTAEFERIVHFNREERMTLIEEMMYQAHCDDSALRQLCEMAAMQINTRDAYNGWVGDADASADKAS